MKYYEEPLVSVLMNCYNGSRYIKNAIESVILQSYKNWELVIWDNQSTDNSLDIINLYKKKDKRIKCFVSKNHTDLGGGRASAWKHLKGKYLAILDTDDLFKSDKLLKQVTFLEKNKDIGICISNTEFFSSNQKKPLYKSTPPIKEGIKTLIEKYYISLESILLSLDYANSNNIAFDKRYSHIADFDLIVRITLKAKLSYMDEILSAWRVDESSQTWSNQEQFYYELINWTNDQFINKDFFKYKNSLRKLKTKSYLRLISEKILKKEFTEIKRIILKKKIFTYFVIHH